MCTSKIILLALAPAFVQGGGHFHAGYASNYAPSVGQPVKAATSGYSYRPAPQRAPVSSPQVSGGGGFTPDQLAFLERKKMEAGGSSPASSPVQVNAGGFTPDQLAFLERKKMETGSTAYDRPARMSSYGQPARRSASPNRDGAYSSRYAPSYQESPRMMLEATETSPNETSPGVMTVLAAVLIGALAGSALNLYVARFRRGASPNSEALLG